MKKSKGNFTIKVNMAFVFEEKGIQIGKEYMGKWCAGSLFVQVFALQQFNELFVFIW